VGTGSTLREPCSQTVSDRPTHFHEWAFFTSAPLSAALDFLMVMLPRRFCRGPGPVLELLPQLGL
jgi:hypothetical protein